MSIRREVWRRPGVILGAGWLVLLALLSVAAPLWRPYDPATQDLAARFSGPSSAHWLGTDNLGRDLLSQIFSASGETLLAALITVAVALVVAVPLVLIAAERGRTFERFSSRGAEVLMALPATVILLAVIGVLGVRTYLTMAILGFLISAALYRVLLGVAQSLHQRLYVDAARVDGAGPVRVGLKYILPGLTNVMAVQVAQLFAVSILVQAGLAFMGFGPAYPAPSWGGMIANASHYIYEAPWMMVPSGVILALTVIAANAFADGLAGNPDPPRRTGRARRRADRSRPAAVPAAARVDGPPRLLEVTGLAVKLEGGHDLVSDVSLGVQAGRVLGLVGESGCGKTLTALAVLGLLPSNIHAAGSVRYEGRELVGLSERELRPFRGRQLAMIPQDPMVALDPLAPIGAQLIEPIRRFHGVGRKAARRLAIEHLERVGIADPERVLGARRHEVSGGMAQRITIALALTGEPRLLVADEPTTALDVTVQADILELLRGLIDETGIGLIMVSHDMGVVADICDEVAVMYAGHVVEHGPVDSVLEHPRHPYTSALLAASPHLGEQQAIPARLATIPGQVPPAGQWPTGCRFASRCAFAMPACEAVVELTADDDASLVRCVRSRELATTLAERPAPGPDHARTTR